MTSPKEIVCIEGQKEIIQYEEESINRKRIPFQSERV